MNWYKLKIDFNDNYYSFVRKMQGDFSTYLRTNDVSHDSAIYSKFSTKDASTTFLFTPDVKEFALNLNAIPCSEPSKEDLGSFLVGFQQFDS